MLHLQQMKCQSNSSAQLYSVCDGEYVQSTSAIGLSACQTMAVVCMLAWTTYLCLAHQSEQPKFTLTKG